MGNELGTKIRRLREQAGLTQVQLARMAEISREWLAKIESGKNPTLFVVVRLAAALETRLPHLSVADLFEGYDGILPMRSAQTPLGLGQEPAVARILGPAGAGSANTGRLLSVRDANKATILNVVNRRDFLAYMGGMALSPYPLSTPADTSRTAPGVNDHFGRADALSLGAWIESTNTSDEVIEYLDALALIVAREHVYFPHCNCA